MSVNPLGQAVRDRRRQSGLSQNQLALRARTSQSAISRIETGAEEPSFERFAQIMRVLGYAPAVELGPIAEPDAEPRRLIEQAQMTPQERFESGLNWLRFLRSVPAVSTGDG
jgi:transcriptional regulator with XRE-family HTH domain